MAFGYKLSFLRRVQESITRYTCGDITVMSGGSRLWVRRFHVSVLGVLMEDVYAQSCAEDGILVYLPVACINQQL